MKARMRAFETLACVVLAVHIRSANAFTKYGRTCADIGCSSNEHCVMKEDPCRSYADRSECGMYPTCERVAGATRTCENFVCPPTMKCAMTGTRPRCVDASGDLSGKHDGTQYSNQGGEYGANNNHGSSGGGGLYPHLPQPSAPDAPPTPPPRTHYQPGSLPSYPGAYPGYPSNNPSYPSYPTGGQTTTPRPNGYRPAGGHGNGYSGGSVGSGYPGYPTQPPYSGYPGYNSGSRYPSSAQYPYSSSSNNRNRQGQSSAPSLTDRLSDSLKKLGKDFLRNILTTRT